MTNSGTFGTLPSFEELENPKSNLATEIYSEDGVLLGSYYVPLVAMMNALYRPSSRQR